MPEVHPKYPPTRKGSKPTLYPVAFRSVGSRYRGSIPLGYRKPEMVAHWDRLFHEMGRSLAIG